MTPSTHPWLTILVLTSFVIAVTGAGVFFGWAMDHSLLPPHGGGWRCYVDCIAIVWGMALVPALLFVGVPIFARWLSEKISA